MPGWYLVAMVTTCWPTGNAVFMVECMNECLGTTAQLRTPRQVHYPHVNVIL